MSKPKFQQKASEEKDCFFDMIGKDVTFVNDIVSIGGSLLHGKGEKAYISDVIYTSGYWSNLCHDIYVQPKISSFQINNIPGHYRPDTFIEYQKQKEA